MKALIGILATSLLFGSCAKREGKSPKVGNERDTSSLSAALVGHWYAPQRGHMFYSAGSQVTIVTEDGLLSSAKYIILITDSGERRIAITIKFPLNPLGAGHIWEISGKFSEDYSNFSGTIQWPTDPKRGTEKMPYECQYIDDKQEPTDEDKVRMGWETTEVRVKRSYDEYLELKNE